MSSKRAADTREDRTADDDAAPVTDTETAAPATSSQNGKSGKNKKANKSGKATAKAADDTATAADDTAKASNDSAKAAGEKPSEAEAPAENTADEPEATEAESTSEDTSETGDHSPAASQSDADTAEDSETQDAESSETATSETAETQEDDADSEDDEAAAAKSDDDESDDKETETAESGDSETASDEAEAAPPDEDDPTRGSFDSQGTKVVWRAWLPADEVRGVVVIAHGIAEHSGRYQHVGERLRDAGYATYALDHLGHGESGGSRGNFGTIDQAADNIAALLTLAGERHSDAPRFVVGHSAGSLITLHLVTRKSESELDLRGVVLSATLLDIPLHSAVERTLAPRMNRIGPALSRIVPNLGLLQLDSSAISRDPEVVTAYDADPLVLHGKVPAHAASEVFNTARAVVTRLDRLTIPTLVLHGTADTIAAPSSADKFEKDTGSDDVTVKRYDGLFHEVFNEPERDEVLGDVVSWLESHTN